MRQILLPAKLYRSQEPHLVLIIVNLIKESNFTKSFLIFFFSTLLSRWEIYNTGENPVISR